MLFRSALNAAARLRLKMSRQDQLTVGHILSDKTRPEPEEARRRRVKIIVDFEIRSAAEQLYARDMEIGRQAGDRIVRKTVFFNDPFCVFNIFDRVFRLVVDENAVFGYSF